MIFQLPPFEEPARRCKVFDVLDANVWHTPNPLRSQQHVCPLRPLRSQQHVCPLRAADVCR